MNSYIKKETYLDTNASGFLATAQKVFCDERVFDLNPMVYTEAYNSRDDNSRTKIKEPWV